MAHKKLDHLWGEKTLGMINKYFVWPGMSKDVFTHSRECGQCQVKLRYVHRKAPTDVCMATRANTGGIRGGFWWQ